MKFMTVLIDHGAELDHQDKDGITALHWSCASGHLEAVKLLIRNRAFPNFTELDTDRWEKRSTRVVGKGLEKLLQQDYLCNRFGQDGSGAKRLHSRLALRL